MSVRAAFAATLISVSASACCILGPCDRVAILSGTVKSLAGLDVSGAQIEWNGNQAKSGANGFFEVGGIEKGRYQLMASAAGFKPLCVAAKPLHQRLIVVLAPQDSPQPGSAFYTTTRGDRVALSGCT